MYKPVERQAQELRRYDEMEMLETISKASLLRAKDEHAFEQMCKGQNSDPRTSLRDCQLAFVAKLVLHFYGKPRFSMKRLQPRDLFEACGNLTKHQEPSSYPLRSMDDLEKHFMRLAYQQFPDFYGSNDTFGRTHLLFRTCATEVQNKTGFDLDGAYNKATGLTLDKCWEITFAICGFLLNQGSGVIVGPLRNGDMNKRIDDADVATYMKLISLPPEEYKGKMALPRYRLDQCETFNPNPLVNWPIIALRDNKWLVPIFPYLFRRGTEQVFYDVIASSGREFSGFFGFVFEDYADRMLSMIGEKYEVVKELPYSREGKVYKTCDRIIIKNNGDAVLLECKTKRLGVEAKLTGDEEKLRNDVTDIDKGRETGNVVHAIRQLKRTEEAIREKCPGLEELNSKITGRMNALVMTLEPYYFANGGYFRRIIEEELKKGDYVVEGYKWQLVDARGFEILCALSQKIDFMTLINEKSSTPEKEVQDMATFIKYEAVNGGQTERTIPMNPVIDNELRRFVLNVRSRYDTTSTSKIDFFKRDSHKGI